MEMKRAYMGPVAPDISDEFGIVDSDWKIRDRTGFDTGRFYGFLKQVGATKVAAGHWEIGSGMILNKIPIAQTPNISEDDIVRLLKSAEQDYGEVYYVPEGLVITYQMGKRCYKGDSGELEIKTTVCVDIGGEEQAVLGLERRIIREVIV